MRAIFQHYQNIRFTARRHAHRRVAKVMNANIVPEGIDPGVGFGTGLSDPARQAAMQVPTTLQHSSVTLPTVTIAHSVGVTAMTDGCCITNPAVRLPVTVHRGVPGAGAGGAAAAPAQQVMQAQPTGQQQGVAVAPAEQPQQQPQQFESAGGFALPVKILRTTLFSDRAR